MASSVEVRKRRRRRRILNSEREKERRCAATVEVRAMEGEERVGRVILPANLLTWGGAAREGRPLNKIVS